MNAPRHRIETPFGAMELSLNSGTECFARNAGDKPITINGVEYLTCSLNMEYRDGKWQPALDQYGRAYTLYLSRKGMANVSDAARRKVKETLPPVIAKWCLLHPVEMGEAARIRYEDQVAKLEREIKDKEAEIAELNDKIGDLTIAEGERCSKGVARIVRWGDSLLDVETGKSTGADWKCPTSRCGLAIAVIDDVCECIAGHKSQ